MSSFNESDSGRKGGLGTGSEFMVLDHIELIEARSLIVQHTCTMLEIPEDIAVRLLRRFGWETKRATEIWKTDKQSCCSLLGLPDGIYADIIVERDTVCGVCGIRQRVNYDPGCGHFTCAACMQKYIASKVQSSKTRHCCLDMRCPHKGCEYALQKGLIDAVSTDGVMESLQDHEMQSFVDDNPSAVRCPAKRCDNVIWCEGTDLNQCKGLNVTCTCGMSFCFNCRREAHAPLKCKTVQEIQQRVDSKGGQNRKLLSRMKPCPKCRKLASRRNMENDIRCKSCGYRFCWQCLGIWDNQYEDLENTIEFYHHCKFQTRSNSTKDPRYSARRSPISNIQKLRCQLMEQYDTHDKGIQLALMKIVQFRIKLVANEQQNQRALDEWKFLSDTWHQAVSTHILLKWTYLLGSYLCDQEEQGGEVPAPLASEGGVGGAFAPSPSEGGVGGAFAPSPTPTPTPTSSGVPQKLLSIEKLIGDVEKELSELHSLLEHGLLKLEIQMGNYQGGEFLESTFNACTGACTGGRMMATRFGLYQLTKKMWQTLTRIVRFEFEDSELASNGDRATSIASLQQNWYNYAGSEIDGTNYTLQPVPSIVESAISYVQDTNYDRYSYLNKERSQNLPQFENSSSEGSTSNQRASSSYAGRYTRLKQNQNKNNNLGLLQHHSTDVGDSYAYSFHLNLDEVKSREIQNQGGRILEGGIQNKKIDYQQQQYNILDKYQRDLYQQKENGSMWQPRRNQNNDLFKKEYLQGGWN